MLDHVFILAGGSGTRLWPASNSGRPKQFLPVQDGKSLLRLTVERAFGLGIRGSVVIITLADQLEPVLDECRKIDIGKGRIKVVPEPAARNTAPAIAIAAEYVRAKYRTGDDQTVAVLTADHLITPLEKFTADMEKADSLARQDMLVTFGVPPTRPETGYGYIETGEELKNGFRVASFREKPDEETAARFLKQGNYYWNSGMFAFRVKTYLEELSAHTPEIGALFEGVGEKGRSRTVDGIEVVMEGPEVEEIYRRSPKDSIDYAVMEKSRRVSMVSATFDWNDIGSWEEMAALYAKKNALPVLGPRDDANIRADEQELVSINSKGNFVYSDIPVALCGVEDLMVVVKNGVLLIARKGAGQQVKQVVEELKKRGRSDLL
jgi:mannose-1-phosphate guanylyltransferase/mannose-6-phosphate isomerase